MELKKESTNRRIWLHLPVKLHWSTTLFDNLRILPMQAPFLILLHSSNGLF
jgi:hypothetical protein